MKRWWLLFLTLCCLLATATPVSAHELKTDGTISAVLHVEPDDRATSGVPVTYRLVFKDTTHAFTLLGCNCVLRIRENGQLLYMHALATKYPLDSENTFTFPRPDVYALTVSGAPKQPGAFQSFTLQYTLPVARGAATQSRPISLLLWVGGGVLIAIILLAAYKTAHTSE